MGETEDRSAGRGEPSSAYCGDGSPGNVLADKLGELSRELQEEASVQDTLDAIVHGAVDTVPGAEHVSISSVLRRREVHTRASTGDLPRAVDQAQYDAGEGPCLSTLYEQRTFRLDDLDADSPWPRFIARARASGLGSMLAVQLYVTGEELGALNLFSTRAGAFGDESEQVALLFAVHAAVALADAQEQEHLHAALNARDLIGQAKGILMERYKIGPQQAFQLLVVASQRGNVKLRDIAGHLAATGELSTPT